MRAPSRPRSPNSRPAAATMAAIVFCGDSLAGTFSLLITLAPLECRSPSPACRWARKLVHRKIYGPVLRPVRQSGATMPRSTPHHSHRICGDRDGLFSLILQIAKLCSALVFHAFSNFGLGGLDAPEERSRRSDEHTSELQSLMRI